MADKATVAIAEEAGLLIQGGFADEFAGIFANRVFFASKLMKSKDVRELWIWGSPVRAGQAVPSKPLTSSAMAARGDSVPPDGVGAPTPGEVRS
jgi:hypothetical protein